MPFLVTAPIGNEAQIVKFNYCKVYSWQLSFGTNSVDLGVYVYVRYWAYWFLSTSAIGLTSVKDLGMLL